MRRLSRNVKGALEKARDSSLLAVEVYNKPAVKFKSGGYITLMVIAWTSLFHAIFFKNRRQPFCKEHGRFVKIDDDFKYWELGECLSQYFITASNSPIRMNLEFFIPLRNRIEHRSMPELDGNIFGECQAMLLNFDEMLEQEFGTKYCLRESLSFSLQLFPSSESLVDAIKHNPGTKPVVDFIEKFRSMISAEVSASGKFAFKAFLFQVANHKTQNALPVQFVHWDNLSDDEKKRVTQLPALVKFKEVPVSNVDSMKPGEVVKRVQEGLGHPKIIRYGKMVERFTSDTHTRCWHRYKARPPSNSPVPQETNTKFCIYDRMHDDYCYSQAWVDFLIEKLKDPIEFDSLYKKEASGVPSAGS
jgi:hypothetical protein